MGFVHAITAFAIVTAFAATSTAMAEDIVVGEESGWTLHFDYETWSKEKQFFVGDRLIFNYPVGVHNVYKVDGHGFQTCKYPSGENALTSGDDVITLASPGTRWYICGVSNHCELGLKLAINVQQKDGSANLKSAAPGGLVPEYFAWMMAAFFVFLTIVVQV